MAVDYRPSLPVLAGVAVMGRRDRPSMELRTCSAAVAAVAVVTLRLVAPAARVAMGLAAGLRVAAVVQVVRVVQAGLVAPLATDASTSVIIEGEKCCAWWLCF